MVRIANLNTKVFGVLVLFYDNGIRKRIEEFYLIYSMNQEVVI